MKETTEFNNALHGTVNSVYQSLADGKLDLTDLIQFWIDDISRWQEGVKDFKPAAEIQQATNAEMDNLKAQASAQMSSVPDDDAYDIAALTAGLWSGYRIITRKAFEKGEESALLKLQEAGLVTDIKAAKEVL